MPPGTMGHAKPTAPAPLGARGALDSASGHGRTRELQDTQQHELWLRALQPRYHKGPQVPQGLGSPQVPFCHCSPAVSTKLQRPRGQRVPVRG